MEQLKNKDDLIEALDTQNATILAEMVEHKAAAAEQERLWKKTQRLNHELMKKIKRLFPADQTASIFDHLHYSKNILVLLLLSKLNFKFKQISNRLTFYPMLSGYSANVTCGVSIIAYYHIFQTIEEDLTPIIKRTYQQSKIKREKQRDKFSFPLSKADPEKMSSSYSQSFPLFATGANNFNQKEMEMTMIQKRNTVVSPPLRKQRNQPGNPNPDAEVIALSPKTIMATNRFLCEVCNRGFNREQNLQLHGRVHNLSWKPKQKSEKEARRKVYICPEPTCVHHDPSHALGDLT
ncbi:hypothetical protein YC2023_059789 [Brassica napus]